MIAHMIAIISCPVTQRSRNSAVYTWTLTSLYESDTDSALTLFNRYLFVSRVCFPKITMYFNVDDIHSVRLAYWERMH